MDKYENRDENEIINDFFDSYSKEVMDKIKETEPLTGKEIEKMFLILVNHHMERHPPIENDAGIIFATVVETAGYLVISDIFLEYGRHFYEINKEEMHKYFEKRRNETENLIVKKFIDDFERSMLKKDKKDKGDVSSK